MNRDLFNAIRDSLDRVLDETQKRVEQNSVYSYDITILRMLARQGVPRAQDLLDRRPNVRPKRTFDALVLETPRRDGEHFLDWTKRIWAKYDKYQVVESPGTITEELLMNIIAAAQAAQTQRPKVERLPEPQSLEGVPDNALKRGNSAKPRGRKHARISLVDAKPAASL
jgi:hypothetical protein